MNAPVFPSSELAIPAEFQSCFDAQRAAYLQGARADACRAARRSQGARAPDQGKPERRSSPRSTPITAIAANSRPVFAEIFASLDGIHDARKRLKRWMKPRRRSVDHADSSRRAQPPDPAAARRRRRHRAVELSALPELCAAHQHLRRRQPGDGQDVGEFAPPRRAADRDFAEIFSRGQARLLRRRRRPRAGLLVAAVRPSALHRLGRDGAGGDGQRRAQPDAGDARARRQVARDRRAGLPDQDRGRAHPVGEDLQRRPDLHRGRLCLPAARHRGRIRRPLQAAVRQALSGHQRPGLHLDHRPAVL